MTEEGYELAPQQLARVDAAGSVAVRTVRTAARIPVPDLVTRIAAAVAEHEILRTRYTEHADLRTFVQIVDPVGPVAIEEPATGRTVIRAGAMVVEHELGPDGTRLTVELPRLSVDDATWSRLVSLLFADADGTDAAAEVLQYADAAAWLAEILERSAQPEPAGQTSGRRSAALPFLTPLEADDAAGGEVNASTVVEGAALDRLAAMAQKCGVSEAAVLLALWRSLAGRYTRDADGEMAVLSDGRSTAGLENVLGLLERPVPVRLRLAADDSFADAARAAGEALGTVAAIENQVDPGPVVSANLTAAGGPLSFRYREERWARELSAEPPGPDVRGPVHLDCVRGPHGLRLTFAGIAGRVAQTDLDLLAGAYDCQLADALAGDPDRAVGGLRLTVPRAPDAPAVAAEPPVRSATVLSRFLRQADDEPDRPALRCGDTVVSYRDAALRAASVARLLHGHGVRAGHRVALMAPTATETIVAMLGIWLAGAAFVPIDPAWPRQRIETILREADPELLLTPGPTVCAGAAVRTVSAADVDVDADADADVDVDVDADVDVDVDARRPLPDGRAADAAYVIFTSGTSGRPKGVVIGHEQLAHYASALDGELGLSEGAEFAAVSTLAADLAYTAVFPTLAGGGCVQLVPAETATSPAALAEWFGAHPAAAMKLVPSHLAVLLAEAADPLALLPGEALVLGGELLPRPLYQRLREIAPGLRVYNHYGPTETTVGASCVAAAAAADDRCSSIPVGRGLGANVLTVLDGAGCPLPPWCAGEVVISGPGVGLGYLARLRAGLAGFLDADASTSGYRTGDLGRLVPGAGVEIIGRIDDQVKLRGYRVQTGEIEALLTGLPGVGAAAVVPRADDSGLVTHLDAYLVADPGLPVPAVEELRSALADWLPAALVPTGWRVLERLPLTGNGKLDRRALAPIKPPEVRAGRPRDAVEQRLLAIWSVVLDQDISSPDAHFFDSGGQSLRAIKLMAQINNAFGVDLPMSAVFTAPTVAAMAALVRDSGGRDSYLVPLRAVRGPRDGAPIFCFHPDSGSTLDYWDLARLLPAGRSVVGVDSPTLHGRPSRRDATATAAEYAAAIEAAADVAPVLIGWGSGGLMAYATAEALCGSGRKVAQLVLVDSAAPDSADGGSAARVEPRGPDYPVLLVRAEPADAPPDPDRTAGWGAVIGPELGFAAVAADRHSILRHPAVAHLAELIGRELEEA